MKTILVFKKTLNNKKIIIIIIIFKCNIIFKNSHKISLYILIKSFLIFWLNKTNFQIK